MRCILNKWCRKVVGLKSDSSALQILIEATQGTDMRAEADRGSIRNGREYGKLMKTSSKERQQRTLHSCLL